MLVALYRKTDGKLANFGPPVNSKTSQTPSEAFTLQLRRTARCALFPAGVCLDRTCAALVLVPPCRWCQRAPAGLPTLISHSSLHFRMSTSSTVYKDTVKQIRNLTDNYVRCLGMPCAHDDCRDRNPEVGMRSILEASTRQGKLLAKEGVMSWVYFAMAAVFVFGGCLGTLLSALMFAAAENNR